MNLPNRSSRRKLAKKLGLFGKNKVKKTQEQSDKVQAIGKLIHLRNLTEQRNLTKNQNN